MEFEYTSEQMATKLMKFIKDFSDNDNEIENEIIYITESFNILKENKELNALAHYLDMMFMNIVFE